MIEAYPNKIGLDENIDHSKYYIARCQCYNCHEYYGGIKLPKGFTTTQCKEQMVCKNCGIKGQLLIW